MNFPHAFVGAGAALALIAIMLFHASFDAQQGTNVWRALVVWGSGSLIAAGFLIGLGSVA